MGSVFYWVGSPLYMWSFSSASRIFACKSACKSHYSILQRCDESPLHIWYFISTALHFKWNAIMNCYTVTKLRLNSVFSGFRLGTKHWEKYSISNFAVWGRNAKLWSPQAAGSDLVSSASLVDMRDGSSAVLSQPVPLAKILTNKYFALPSHDAVPSVQWKPEH